MQLSIQSDIDKAVKQLGRLNKIVPKAANSAINKTISTVYAKTSSHISKEMGTTVRRVKKDLVKKRSNLRTLTGIITASGGTINLINFKARQTKKGVSAAPWGKRRIFKGVFIGNRGRTVFVRKGRSRLPIRPVFGPSVPRTMAENESQKLMTRLAGRTWSKNFNHEISYRIGKL